MGGDASERFARWFERATGHEPYPFQVRFAEGVWLPEPCRGVPVPSGQPSPLAGEGKACPERSRREEGNSEAPRLCKAGLGEVEGAGLLVDVPTGLGKTAMAR